MDHSLLAQGFSHLSDALTLESRILTTQLAWAEASELASVVLPAVGTIAAGVGIGAYQLYKYARY